MARLHPTISVTDTAYRGANLPLTCFCTVCGSSWAPRWNDLHNGHGCPRCKDTKLSLAQINLRMQQLHPTIEVLGPYLGAFKPLPCHCTVCDRYWQPCWSSLQNGSGCVVCYRSTLRAKLTTPREITERQLAIKHPNITIIGNYVSRSVPTLTLCTLCGTQRTLTPKHLLALRTGCPKCIRPGSAQEREARQTIERLTGWLFPKTRPRWLKGHARRALELDGYNEEHSMAFEYQGPQHYFPMRQFGGASALAALRRRDERKRVTCYRRNIRLIRIPYWEKNMDQFIRNKLARLCVELAPREASIGAAA